MIIGLDSHKNYHITVATQIKTDVKRHITLQILVSNILKVDFLNGDFSVF